MIYQGDCLGILRGLEANSIDSLVTDPPAGISFMGKSWDDDKGGRDQWIKWLSEVMQECLRVMKPGAHGLVWAIPRTSHWTATALENAGFEIRDVVTHLFGSGFPKSLDVGKKLEDWKGFGTALKPASEHWILARKPLSEPTVAKNVLKWGAGAINIDGSRVPSHVMPKTCTNQNIKSGACASDNSDRERDSIYSPNAQGRFPANLLLSCDCDSEEHGQLCAVHLLDEQSGHLHGALNKKDKPASPNKIYGKGITGTNNPAIPGDIGGGASRFFYCAKVSSSERNAGLEGMAEKQKHAPYGETYSRGRNPVTGERTEKYNLVVKNHHPTVKPIKLMSYLIKLITPPNGTVLDPFMGSGSTGIAATSLGFEFIGIEKEQEYFEIADKRITHSSKEMDL